MKYLVFHLDGFNGAFLDTGLTAGAELRIHHSILARIVKRNALNRAWLEAGLARRAEVFVNKCYRHRVSLNHPEQRTTSPLAGS